jgi:SepF-like predicted cell division protein (DUF552 family)
MIRLLKKLFKKKDNYPTLDEEYNRAFLEFYSNDLYEED